MLKEVKAMKAEDEELAKQLAINGNAASDGAPSASPLTCVVAATHWASADSQRERDADGVAESSKDTSAAKAENTVTPDADP